MKTRQMRTTRKMMKMRRMRRTSMFSSLFGVAVELFVLQFFFVLPSF